MSVAPKIQFASLDQLFLDSANPRLGRHNVEKKLSQDEVLELMRDWTLDELAVSFLESGFWPQEALICVNEKETRSRRSRLVVVEGNRRLAALMMIERARDGRETRPKWRDMIRGYPKSAFERLASLPYLLMPDRKSVSAFLGFRHVTGIKEWNPAEKAQFIAHLIENEGLSYDEARKRIGSNTPTVRRNYISFRLLLQMENELIDVAKVEERFSVLYLSLRTQGVRTYLQINVEADPETAMRPVPPSRLRQLESFAKWLFGTKKTQPLISDSREIDTFGSILESPTAVDYLERTEEPSFRVAHRMAGVAETEVAEHVERAADEAEEALRAAHQHKSSSRLRDAVRRLGADAMQLLSLFPIVKEDVLKKEG